MHPNKRKWSQVEIAMLGTKSDTAIAEQLGVARLTVARKRKEIGIAANKRELRPCNFRLPNDLMTSVAAKCRREGIDKTAAVVHALEAWVENAE